MTINQKYSYTVLRYHHDPITGEFINIGVLIVSDSGYANIKCRKSLSRISNVFKGFNASDLRSKIKYLKNRLQNKDFGMLVDSFSDARTLGLSAIPADDSSLQWSPLGGGITKDPERTLDVIFDRFVMRYDEKPQSAGRTDEDIWRTVKGELQRRRLDNLFELKIISTSDDKVQFNHVWKNGIYHCVEPISFDLSSEDGIREKAYKWLGRMTNIQSAKSEFKLYVVTAAPKDDNLTDAYKIARAALKKCPLIAPCMKKLRQIT